MKKILVIVTNVSKYQGVDVDRPTGLWLGEAVHFVDEIEKAGFTVDYASPQGGYTPIDPHSLENEMMTELDWEYYTNHQFMNRLGNTLSISQINPKEYSAIYYTGGHGVIWDFPNNEKLADVALEIYNNGGIISSVCHGAAGILNIKYNNEYLIKGKTVTGFSNSEEKEVQLDKLVPYLTESELIDRGAKYIKAKDNWLPFAVEDQRIVTGQNPASGKAVAEKVISLLK